MLQGPFREVNGSHCKTVGDALLAGRIAAATASYLQGTISQKRSNQNKVIGSQLN